MVKIFAHRGYVINNAKENSIESLNEAVKNNFYGVEFDVWFVNNELYVCHDEPKEEDLYKLPKFSDYLIHGNKIKYWIDFKNLDEANARNAIKIVKTSILKAEIFNQNIYFAPGITSLNQAAPIYEKIKEIFANPQLTAFCVEINKDSSQRYYQDLKKLGVTFLSLNHKNIDEDFVKKFKDITIFAWTVNEEERAKELENMGIKFIASDKIKP